jgi:hypothetical protein
MVLISGEGFMARIAVAIACVFAGITMRGSHNR